MLIATIERTIMNEQLVSTLAQDLVGQIAPREASLFKPISTAYFKNPKVIDKPRAGDNMLGFGESDEVSIGILTWVGSI